MIQSRLLSDGVPSWVRIGLWPNNDRNVAIKTSWALVVLAVLLLFTTSSWVDVLVVAILFVAAGWVMLAVRWADKNKKWKVN